MYNADLFIDLLVFTRKEWYYEPEKTLYNIKQYIIVIKYNR